MFLSVTHSYNYKDITAPHYILDSTNTDTCTVFDLQQKHLFGLLVSTLKESSMLPFTRQYSDLNAADYGDAQMLYHDLIAHYTQGLSGHQHVEILK